MIFQFSYNIFLTLLILLVFVDFYFLVFFFSPLQLWVLDWNISIFNDKSLLFIYCNKDIMKKNMKKIILKEENLESSGKVFFSERFFQVPKFFRRKKWLRKNIRNTFFSSGFFPKHTNLDSCFINIKNSSKSILILINS